MLKVVKHLNPTKVVKHLSYWPPYFFSGIKIAEINNEFTKIKVVMKQWPWNTNYVGSHFGGSLYSMCDPFFMFILLEHMKKDHIIWDKSAEIKFIRPAVGEVQAEFEITLDQIKQIQKEALDSYSLSPLLKTKVIDSRGETIALVNKTLYVRKKDRQK